MPLTDTAKGKITEMLVAVAAVAQSNGLLFRISLPLVDDEGIDLLVTHKQTGKTLLLQIKSAFKLNRRGKFRVDVRKKTLGFDHKKLLVLVYYDITEDRLGDSLWIVDVPIFRHLLRRQKLTRTIYIFDSSFLARDMWTPFRITLNELGSTLLNYFNVLP